MSGIINKAKAALADVTHKDNTTTKTTHTTTTSHSTVPATGTTGTTGTHVGSGSHVGTTGHSTGTGVGGTSHAASTTAGPHSSDIANKLDPRVDSDLSGGSHAGLNQTTHHQTGNPQTFGSGVGGTHGSTNAGPHSSNIGNAADPRVDSDLSHTHQTGTGIGGHGATHSTGLTGNTHSTGAYPTTHTTGTHSTGLTGTHATGTHATGTHATGTHAAGTNHGATAAHSGVIGSTQPKPTLGQKLNPKIDADGDGKAGIMD